jgi:hypothetical protein
LFRQTVEQDRVCLELGEPTAPADSTQIRRLGRLRPHQTLRLFSRTMQGAQRQIHLQQPKKLIQKAHFLEINQKMNSISFISMFNFI